MLRLDRYVPGGRPKFRVISMRTGADVDPRQCFVLKRRDTFALAALEAYATAAAQGGDRELAEDVRRLTLDWRAETMVFDDGKMPD